MTLRKNKFSLIRSKKQELNKRLNKEREHKINLSDINFKRDIDFKYLNLKYIHIILFIISFYFILFYVYSVPVNYWGFSFLDNMSAFNETLYAYGDCFNNGTTLLAQTNIDSFGSYSIDIPMDDPNTQTDEGCQTNQQIYFVIDQYRLYNPYIITLPQPGNVVNLNIYAKSVQLTQPDNNSITTTNQTHFFWNQKNKTNDISYRLEISTDYNFNNIIRQITTSNKDYQLSQSEALEEDGVYYWRIFILKNNTHVFTSEIFKFTQNAYPPKITSTNPVNNSWVNSQFQLTVTTDRDSECRYSLVENTPFSSKILMDGTGLQHTALITLPSEGLHNIYIQCNSNNNTMLNDYILVIGLDTTPPSTQNAWLRINNDESYSNSGNLQLDWGGFTDSLSGIKLYYYSLSNNLASAILTTSTTATITTNQEGNVYAYVWAQDNAGNICSSISDSIFIDHSAPSINAWSTDPEPITEAYYGNLTLFVNFNDLSDINYSKVRYKFSNTDFTNFTNMTHILGKNYQFKITDNPNYWREHVLQNITFNVYVVDIHGFSSEFNLTKFIHNVSHAPILKEVGPFVIDQDSNLTFYLNVTFYLGNNTLHFSCDNPEINVNKINERSARVFWIPHNKDVGLHVINCSVNDSDYFVTQHITIRVNNINDKPEILNGGNFSAYYHKRVYFSINVRDPDNDTLFILTNDSRFKPRIVYINYTNFKIEFNFTPILMHEGFHLVNLTLTDGQAFDSKVISINIGYCGDNICNNNFENESNCKDDCYIPILTQEKALAVKLPLIICTNKTNQGFVYELHERATCKNKGLIINGLETCGNVSGAMISLFMLKNSSWVKVDELASNNQGIFEFILKRKSYYKIEAKRSGYKSYSKIFYSGYCRNITQKSQTKPKQTNENNIKPEKKPKSVFPYKNETRSQKKELEKTSNYFVFLVILFILLFLLSYILYFKVRDKNPFILKLRIKYHKIKNKIFLFLYKKYSVILIKIFPKKYQGIDEKLSKLRNKLNNQISPLRSMRNKIIKK